MQPEPPLQHCLAMTRAYLSGTKYHRAGLALCVTTALISAYGYGSGNSSGTAVWVYFTFAAAMSVFILWQMRRCRNLLHGIWLSYIDRAETRSEREELIDAYWQILLKGKGEISPFTDIYRRFSRDRDEP